MKSYGILIAASMAAACASHPAPDAASGTSPEPMAESATQAGDGMATKAAPVAGNAPAPSTTDAAMPATPSTAMNGATPSTAMNGATTSAVATNDPAAPAKPDNSRVNSRDKDGSTLTPMNQGTSEGDRKITQQIRQAVMKDSSLSFTAKNVKIITINGKVTLRGPVKTDQERSSIEAAAKSVAGVNQVDNLLEAKN